MAHRSRRTRGSRQAPSLRRRLGPLQTLGLRVLLALSALAEPSVRPCSPLAVMARGPKRHLKRLNAPKHWMLDKLGGVWAPRPSTGPHKLRECLPLIILLRNRLKYALNTKEVKYILMQRMVKVDGKARTDKTYPAGFMGARLATPPHLPPACCSGQGFSSALWRVSARTRRRCSAPVAAIAAAVASDHRGARCRRRIRKQPPTRSRDERPPGSPRGMEMTAAPKAQRVEESAAAAETRGECRAAAAVAAAAASGNIYAVAAD